MLRLECFVLYPLSRHNPTARRVIGLRPIAPRPLRPRVGAKVRGKETRSTLRPPDAIGGWGFACPAPRGPAPGWPAPRRFALCASPLAPHLGRPRARQAA